MVARTTVRTSDGSAVPWDEALEAWTAAARPVLERVAGDYNRYITYKELAEAVQEDAGITTESPFRNWIGTVLRSVTEAQRPDEPMLSALVVKATEDVGDGYGDAAAVKYGSVPDDLDLHAATERLECYRAFGATLPTGGGVPTLTRKVVQQRKKELPLRRDDVCPECNMARSAVGTCFCD